MLSTTAIQEAIDACTEHGGSRLVIPAGTYRRGSIFLKSRLEHHFERGVRLIASDNPEDYNRDVAYPGNHGSVREAWTGQHLFIAYDCETVGINLRRHHRRQRHCFYDEPVPEKLYA